METNHFFKNSRLCITQYRDHFLIEDLKRLVEYRPKTIMSAVHIVCDMRERRYITRSMQEKILSKLAGFRTADNLPFGNSQEQRVYNIIENVIDDVTDAKEKLAMSGFGKGKFFFKRSIGMLGYRLVGPNAISKKPRHTQEELENDLWLAYNTNNIQSEDELIRLMCAIPQQLPKKEKTLWTKETILGETVGTSRIQLT